jgi:hypothetical protein
VPAGRVQGAGRHTVDAGSTMQNWQVLRGELRVEASLLGEAGACTTADGVAIDWMEVVFPIIDTDADGVWKPVGTAFFVGNCGLFATAKHVLVENNEVRPGLAGVQILPAQGVILIRKVRNATPHYLADLAVGCLAQEAGPEAVPQNHILSLSRRAGAAGDRICTYAYPSSECIGRTETGSPEIGFACSEVPGQILEYFPRGRDRVMHRAPCYRTTCNPAGGASGGPVAGTDGSVFAVNSTGFDGAEEGFCSSVAPLLELKVRGVKLPGEHTTREMSLAELAALGVVALE